jgi:hypothetical protein
MDGLSQGIELPYGFPNSGATFGARASSIHRTLQRIGRFRRLMLSSAVRRLSAREKSIEPSRIYCQPIAEGT